MILCLRFTLIFTHFIRHNVIILIHNVVQKGRNYQDTLLQSREISRKYY